MSEKKDASVKPPVGQAHIQGVSPTIEAIRNELDIISKVSWRIFISLAVIITIKYSISSTFWQWLLEIIMLILGIYLIQSSIKRVTNISGRSSTGTRSSANINV